jgi:tyrosine-protein kinase Etk/Wzc
MATETQLGELSGIPSGSRQLPPQNEISLLDLLIMLAERRRTILAVTATCTIVAIIVSLLLPKSYTATTTLLPPQQSSSMSSILASQLGSLGSMAMLAGGGLAGLKNPNDMYVAMFRSETVEDAMIRDFHLKAEYRARYMADARKAFESHSKVDASGKDNLIHISVTDHDPKRAAEMANGYVNDFHHLSEHLAITEAGQRRIFFQQQLEDAKNKLADAEEALKKTQQKTGLIQLDSQARALIESAAGLRAQIAAKEVQIQAMRTYATGENAQMVQAEQELESLRSQLAALGGSESNPDSLIVPKGKVPEAGLEYLRKLRDVKYYETIFEILARQFEMAKLDEAKEGAVVQVVDPATVPERRSFPKRALIVIVATIVGLFLGVLVALTRAGFAALQADPESAAKLALLRNTLRRRKSPVT